MRLEEGVSFSGSPDPNWGPQGRGVCGESKDNSTGGLEKCGYDWLPNWEKNWKICNKLKVNKVHN